MYWMLVLLITVPTNAPAFADGGHDHYTVPTLKNQATTTVTTSDDTVTLAFGPVDLPHQP